MRSVLSALCAVCAVAGLACVDNPYVLGALREDASVPADASTDAAVLDPCTSHPGALACSGFEVEGLDDWPAPVIVNEAEIGRSTARARSGVGSLHARSSDADSTAVVVQEFAARSDGELYLRVWLYVPGQLPTETINLFFLGDDPNPTTDPVAPFLGMDINLEAGVLQLYSPQNAPDRITGTLTIPRDRWFCLRGVFAVGEEGAVQLFVDDAPALEVLPHDTLPDAGIHLLRAGVDWSSGQTEPFEVFMDDLVLSDALVACSAP